MTTTMLAVDTATRTVGLAVYDGLQVLGETVWHSRDFHTVELIPAISELLTKARLSSADLGAIAVSIGPGSFTGLRIGMAAAKGICMARNLPLVGVPTLDALASAQPVRQLPLAAVLQAGRSRLAVGWYRAEEQLWVSTQEIEVMAPKELSMQIKSPTIICGELSADDRQILARKHKNIILTPPALSLRRPAFLAELGWKRWQDGDVDDPASLSPVYLHTKDPIPG
jgi:tRNA threonylcarbamoyladenosine biosynthesis protein TsaB